MTSAMERRLPVFIFFLGDKQAKENIAVARSIIKDAK
jgi:hypothetical protein